jgi:MFS-type transporter involved in bile tolerance (Atg22 family)
MPGNHQIYITLTSVVQPGQIVSLGYTPSSPTQIQSIYAVSAMSLSGYTITNNSVLPVLTTGSIIGRLLKLNYSTILDGSFVPNTSQYTVYVNSNSVGIANIALLNGTQEVRINLINPVSP